MKTFISIILGLLLCTTFLYPGFADAAKPDKYNITVAGDDAEVNIRIVGTDATIFVNDDGLATQAYVQSVLPKGSAGDLITWIVARRADKWVSEIGVVLPDMIVWHMIKTGEMSVKLKDVSERLAVAEAIIEQNEGDIAALRRDLDALIARNIETDKF